MRTRFGSTVHFSPNDSSKEFFLVVSFSSACFPLSVESVGIALQCCLGGSALGFRVKHLAGRQFCFSVASNRVGHFIYGLKDRIWPDFVCHFNLFRQAAWEFTPLDLHWHADKEIVEVSARSPLAIKSNLSFLKHSRNTVNSSALELAKFGLTNSTLTTSNPVPKCNSGSSVIDHAQDSTNSCFVKVGSFDPFPIPNSNVQEEIVFGKVHAAFTARPSMDMPIFQGINFKNNYWESIPDFILLHILDF